MNFRDPSRRTAPNPKPDRLVHGLHSRGALPHLKRENATYFVTFRLAGTMPQEVLIRLKQEREAILQQAIAENRPLTWEEQKQLFNWYADRVDAFLDRGHGECWLREDSIASIVAGALYFFHGDRYRLHSWVIMPNHVHVVVHPEPPWTLSKILKSWKNFSALEANRILGRIGSSFWQRESYDHLCRDDKDFHHCCQYTIMNPVNAGLCTQPETWRWSGAWQGDRGADLRSAGNGTSGSEFGE